MHRVKWQAEGRTQGKRLLHENQAILSGQAQSVVVRAMPDDDFVAPAKQCLAIDNTTKRMPAIGRCLDWGKAVRVWRTQGLGWHRLQSTNRNGYQYR